jgi:hypothetical protein
MADHYFQRVHALTPTKFWINNPTRQEADWALAEGAWAALATRLTAARCCSTARKRVSMPPGLGRSVRAWILPPQAKRNAGLVSVIAKVRAAHQQHPREHGYVGIQGDPSTKMIRGHHREARKNRAVSENICCKIPTTEAGLKAMETLVAEDIPINATEGPISRRWICVSCEKVSKQPKTPQVLHFHITRHL